jgi:hypothetical protein
MKHRKCMARAGCAVSLSLLTVGLSARPAAANYSAYTASSVCSFSYSNWNAGGTYPWNGQTQESLNCTSVGVQFPGMAIAWSSSNAHASRTNPKPASTIHHWVDYAGGTSGNKTLSCGC